MQRDREDANHAAAMPGERVATGKGPRHTEAQAAIRFLWRLIPVLAPGLGWLVFCFLLFNLVDPYGVTGWAPIAGFNDVKPVQRDFDRVYKPFAFLEGNYNALVLGASADLRGIDPRNPQLLSAGYHFYNFALSEERPYEAAEIADFALPHEPAIKTILYELEFTRYDVEPRSIGDMRPYYPKGAVFPWAIRQYLYAAVSPQGLEDDYETVAASRDHLTVLRQSRYGLEEMPGVQPGPRYDYTGEFANVERAYLNVFLPKLAIQARGWMSHGFDHAPLRRLIERARAQQARLILYISPSHALEMESLRRMGLWPAFERWKQQLVCVVHGARAQHPNADIALWDFSGYNAVTTEPLPAPGSGATMGYWDPVHYTIGVGNKVVATVLHLKGGGGDFGVELNRSDIEANLAAMRAAQASYEATHAADLKWLASMDETPASELPALPPLATTAPVDCAHDRP